MSTVGNVSGICTTLNGGQILCSTSEINDAWHLEIKGGSGPKNQIKDCSMIKLIKKKNVFEAPKYEQNYELDPFEETSITSHEIPTKPFLTCLHYSDSATASQSSLNPNQVPKRVFKTFFGRNATLTSKEVLLVGLPDGKTFCASITPNNSILNLTLIANLYQPVIYIKIIKEGLLIAGYKGKIWLHDRNQRKHIFYIPEPVKSLHYHDESLFHTIPSGHIKTTKFEKNLDGGLSVKISSTKVNDAEKILIVTQGNHCIMAYITKNGDLKALPQDLTETNFTNITAKTLLDEIQVHMDETITLKNELEFLKMLLHNVSLASWFAAKQTNQFGESCSLSIIHKSDGSYDLIVNVKNMQTLATTNNWYLACQLIEKDRNNNSFSICKSVKIDSSETKCVINISLELLNKFNLKVPLVLNCAIVVSQLKTGFEKYNHLIESLFPMCFDIKSFQINELTLLENLTDVPFNHNDKKTIKSSILEIAKTKLKDIPLSAEIREKLTQNSINLPTDTNSFSFTFLNSSFMKEFPKISMMKKDLVTLVTNKSLVTLAAKNDKYFYQDIPINVEASNLERHSQLTISSPSLLSLVSIRRAMGEEFLTMLKAPELDEICEEIKLDLNMMETVQHEHKKLNQTSNSDIDKLIEMYLEIRQRLSLSLPIF